MPTSAGQQAEWAINPLDKERWLKIAEHWLQMAQEATTHQGTGVLHEAAFEMTRPPTEAAYRAASLPGVGADLSCSLTSRSRARS
jgi:hypothetical protein